MTSVTNDKENVNKGQDGHGEMISVAVATTSGFYPESGFISVPVHQKIAVILHKAAEALGLTDTSGWVVRTADNQTLNPNASYEESGLNGEVTIDWSAPEGGGGRG